PFTVALDPRLSATTADLQAQLKLQLQIHNTLNTLDELLNPAIAMSARLAKDPGATQRTALAGLNQALNTLVQLKLRGDETDAVFGTRLHLHLAFLAGEVAEGYHRPTAAEYAAYKYLAGKIAAGEKALQAAMQAAGGSATNY
ncbi:MAG: hypothetical protein ACRD1F_08695, partial [Terriglobales bacterium]